LQLGHVGFTQPHIEVQVLLEEIRKYVEADSLGYLSSGPWPTISTNFAG